MNTFKASLVTPHVPVMLNEVIDICTPLNNKKEILDCTFGGGGYSRKLLSFPNTQVTAIDRDRVVIDYAEKLKKIYNDRFHFHLEKFSNLDKVIDNQIFDIIIFDLGISTIQLQDMSRGFSFKAKDRLDMCMGLSSMSAEDVVNNFDEQQLKLILKIFGEENEASIIAKNIIKKRSKKKITTVQELVEVIEASKKKNRNNKINVSTKTFQAFRIFVNKEITELIEGMIKATKLLKPGGKLIIISFHSIEDKIVKFYFRNYSSNKSKPSRYLPEENNLDLTLFEDYKNRVIRASSQEVENNPPSRSAKLRYAIRNLNTFNQPVDLRTKFQKYIQTESINV